MLGCHGPSSLSRTDSTRVFTDDLETLLSRASTKMDVCVFLVVVCVLLLQIVKGNETCGGRDGAASTA